MVHTSEHSLDNCTKGTNNIKLLTNQTAFNTRLLRQMDRRNTCLFDQSKFQHCALHWDGVLMNKRTFELIQLQ